MRSRKSQADIYYVIFEIVLAVLVGLMLLNRAQSIDDIMNQRFVARDVALVIDALAALPGQAYYEYESPTKPPEHIKTFPFRYGPGRVEVGEDSYQFASSERLPFTGGPLAPPTFLKTDSALMVVSAEEKGKLFQPAFSCLKVEHKPWSLVAIDPAGGTAADFSQDPGMAFKDAKGTEWTEMQVTDQLAGNVANALKKYSVVIARPPNAFVRPEQRLAGAKNADLVVGIAVSDAPGVQVFFDPGITDAPVARSLGCAIVNAVRSASQKLDPAVSAGSVLLPADFSTIPDNHPLSVFKGPRPAVLVRIGSTTAYDQQLLAPQNRRIAVDAIITALERS
jgi:hypothetical protein